MGGQRGYPDIILLPKIASYYKEEKLTEYRKRARKLFQRGENEERLYLWREAEIEFPNDLSVAHEVMFALQSVNSKANADQIISCGEKILANSTDTALRDDATLSLCYTYADVGNIEESKNMQRC